MLRLTFTQAEAEALEDERFQHPHPHVRRKMEALWLKSQGLAHQDIARLAGVSGKTLRTYLRQYVEGGVAGLRETHFRRPQSELVAHQETITAYLLAHPPASINEAVDAIRSVLSATLRNRGRARLSRAAADPRPRFPRARPDGQAQAAPGGNRGSPPFGTAEVVALPGQSSRGPVLFASAWARASL